MAGLLGDEGDGERPSAADQAAAALRRRRGVGARGSRPLWPIWSSGSRGRHRAARHRRSSRRYVADLEIDPARLGVVEDRIGVGRAASPQVRSQSARGDAAPIAIGVGREIDSLRGRMRAPRSWRPSGPGGSRRWPTQSAGRRPPGGPRPRRAESQSAVGRASGFSPCRTPLRGRARARSQPGERRPGLASGPPAARKPEFRFSANTGEALRARSSGWRPGVSSRESSWR